MKHSAVFLLVLAVGVHGVSAFAAKRRPEAAERRAEHFNGPPRPIERPHLPGGRLDPSPALSGVRFVMA